MLVRQLGLGAALALAACGDGTPPAVIPVAPAPSSNASATASSGIASTPTVADAGPLGSSACDFATTPPKTVAELLAALHVAPERVWESKEASGMGSLHAAAPSPEILRLSVGYPWDPYHQDRVASVDKVLPKTMETYTIRFADHRAGCAQTLRARWGAPMPKQGPTNDPTKAPLDQYGPFFLHPADGATFALEYHATTPDWAMPKVDADARKKAVRALVTAVTAAKTDDDVKAAFAAIPSDVGMRGMGSLNPHDQWLRFEPPMAATDFGAALGVGTIVAESVGVHMSSWRVATATIGAKLPHLGIWDVEATLTARPESTLPLTPPGPVAHHAIGPAEMVRSVRIFPHVP